MNIQINTIFLFKLIKITTQTSAIILSHINLLKIIFIIMIFSLDFFYITSWYPLLSFFYNYNSLFDFL